MKKYLLFTIVVLISLVSPCYANVNSVLIGIAPSTVEFHLADSNGNLTGYTPGGVILQLPNLTYVVWNEPTVDPVRPDEIYHLIHRASSPFTIQPGKYKLTIYGTNIPTKARISIELRWSEDWRLVTKTSGLYLIYPNLIWSYEFDIPSIPPAAGKITLTKVATVNDLLTDIKAAGSLQYIGNAEYINELIKEVQKIEKERLHPVENEAHDPATPAQRAIKKYQKLLKEITEKYQKPEPDEFVKQEAYAVLKEDLDYIISHVK